MRRSRALALVALLTLSACTTSGLAPGEHRFASAPGPVEQWYRVAGKSDGIPLVILHGGPGQGSMVFEHGAGAQLEKVARVVYYDQRGAGRSARPKDRALYSIPILVEDIEALRRELGVERLVLLGHSFGTVLALEYAAKYPQHSAGLVLTGAAFDFPALIDAMCARMGREKPEAHARAMAAAGPDDRCNPFAGMPDEAERKAWTEGNMFPDPAVARKVEEWDSADGLANSGEMGGTIFSQGLLSYRFAAADRLTMPLLVIHGEEDNQTAIGPMQALVDAAPNRSLLVYEGRGHFMFVEEPERFARDIAGFLSRLPD